MGHCGILCIQGEHRDGERGVGGRESNKGGIKV
jgi:hypothetical protein